MGDAVSLLAILNWRNNAAAMPVDTDPMLYMQYTGLKDTNGKEIYEGDIVRSGNGRLWQVKFGLYNIVTSSHSFNGWHIEGDGAIVPFARSATDEIIGNVYENPHLLTNEK
jgi:uncharacterized phage protein (TIGR01671 family)